MDNKDNFLFNASRDWSSEKSFFNSIKFKFLLRQAFADDEASTRLLQILLFLLLSTASLMLFVSIMLRFLGPMPGGDHSSPGRVRKPVGPLGPPSPSGVLPTPASSVGQPFGVPGEPVHLV